MVVMLVVVVVVVILVVVMRLVKMMVMITVVSPRVLAIQADITYLSVSVPVCLSACLCACLSVCRYVPLSVCLSVSQVSRGCPPSPDPVGMSYGSIWLTLTTPQRLLSTGISLSVNPEADGYPLDVDQYSRTAGRSTGTYTGTYTVQVPTALHNTTRCSSVHQGTLSWRTLGCSSPPKTGTKTSQRTTVPLITRVLGGTVTATPLT